jgi:hypothetical protein
MKKITSVLIMLVALLGFTSLSVAQTPIVNPQYTVNLNFLTGGIYGQISAVDSVFGSQLTTNSAIEGDLLVAPGGGVTDYELGGNYNLCGIKSLENILAGTSLNCGKIEPFAAFVAGLGRVQQGSNPTLDAFAYTAKIGVNYDPTGSGQYTVAFVGGYGKFGPSITGQSNNGFVFYSGLTFGGGSNAEATQAKILRIKASEAKKAAKLAAAKLGE